MYYVMRASAPSLHRESTDTVMLLLRNYNNFNACDIPQIALWLFHLLVGCGSLWVTDGIYLEDSISSLHVQSGGTCIYMCNCLIIVLIPAKS